jgi:hypothetical protein
LRWRPERLIVPVFLLLAASCADETRIREIACQQRLVDATADIRAVRGIRRNIIGPTFARVGKGLEEMALDGCNENQVHNAKALAKLTSELAYSAGAAESALAAGESGLEEQQAVMIFADGLERFEMRRQILRKELAGMTAGEQ